MYTSKTNRLLLILLYFFTEKYCAQRLETRKHGAKQKVSVLESCWPGNSFVSSLKQISNTQPKAALVECSCAGG